MTFAAIALAIATSSPATIAAPPMLLADEPKLAAASLSQGQNDAAIEVLESELSASTDDPALLINLGIAHAQRGNEAKARALFKAAMKSDEVAELETADGDTIDSRRLARKALGMLNRGEFRPPAVKAGQLTLRD